MKVVLVGGRGFFGSAASAQLRSDGHEVVTVDPAPGPTNHLQADILDTARLVEGFRDADAVINFVGLTPVRKPKKGLYQKIHVEGAASVALACEQARVGMLVHVSALGACMDAPTAFLRTKAAGEQVLDVFSGSTLILRPSALLAEDNELIQMLKRLSVTRMFFRTTGVLQPLYLPDAAQFLSACLHESVTGVVEVAGPDLLTLADIARLVYAREERACILLPSWLARLGATTLALLPRTRIGFDQVRSLTLHNTLVPTSGVRQEILSTSITDWLVGAKNPS